MKIRPFFRFFIPVGLLFFSDAHADEVGNSPVSGGASNLKLWYAREAGNWMSEALPIGNGHMGAMLFGGVREERIQFNEESLWLGDENDTGMYQNFGELRMKFHGSRIVTNPSHHISPAGQEVSASWDGEASTKWCMEHQGRFPIVWQIAIREKNAEAATGYTLTCGEDVPDRDPKSWRFLGSQDGSAWTLLDERKNEPVWPARSTARTFKCSNKTPYAHYRFEFLETHGAPHFQIAEIALAGNGSIQPAHGQYHRELDLTRALHRVTYTLDGIHYTREAFASFPAKVIAMRITADKPGSISTDVSLTDAHGAKPRTEDGLIAATGAIPGYTYDGGKIWLPMNYESQVRVLNQGGKRTMQPDGSVRVEGADSLVLLLDAGTDFLQDRSKNWRGSLPHGPVSARLDSAARRSWDELLAEHEKDYRRLFSRLELNLGGVASALPTNQRVAEYKIAHPDLGLEELLFHYGRYLMIASSREGGVPANLQGKWNNSNNPPWRGDYHTDINVEMNYWMPDPANLSECFQPYAAWIQSIREVRTEATRKAFNHRGWMMRGESGLFGGSTWEWTPGTSAWLLQNSYDHYRYTGDKEYLKSLAYPVMKEMCEGWLDRLETLPDGTLVAPKSFSPEQPFLERGVSFEQQIVWDLFTSTIEASEILGQDADFRAVLADKREHLLKPKIGKWGQLQEWMTDRDDPNDHHRHISHLVAVHPGRQISPGTTPALAEAARVSLRARGDDSTGWSTAWKINQWARLHDGDHAHGLFAYLIRPCHGMQMANEGGGLYPNLFDACPPFQIDGNFGFTAGVCEMLAQSHMSELHLLPALPSAWPSGHVRGLRARTGITVDIAWDQGKVKSFTLHSADPKPVRVRVNGELKMVTPQKGE